MTLPRISVLIPVRNAGTMLEPCLQSLFAQQYPALEVLIMDAASTDGTVDIIRKYEDKLAFWRSHADEGTHAALNEGLSRAKGDVIGLLNADDWYEPGILFLAGNAFAEDETRDVVTFEARCVRADNIGGFVETDYLRGKALELNPAFAVPMPNARFFKRELFERYGTFRTHDAFGRMMIGGDLELLLRFSQYDVKNHILPRLGYTYRVHSESLTFGGNEKRYRQMAEEKVDIARHYLNSPHMSAEAKQQIKRWHLRCSARAFCWRLAEGDRKNAAMFASEGLRVSPLRWIPEMLRVALFRRYKGSGKAS